LDTTIFIVTLFEALLIAGMFLLYPRIARRGLLFGVYVGEERSGGEEAQQIARGWQTGIILWTIVSVGIGLVMFMQFRTPFAAVTWHCIYGPISGHALWPLRARRRE
jgi:hypothetical protein